MLFSNIHSSKKDASLYHDDYGTGLACTMTTDENGVAVSEPLRKGRYLIQEEDEAEGYVYDLVELRATVESDETTYLSVTNQPICLFR